MDYQAAKTHLFPKTSLSTLVHRPLCHSYLPLACEIQHAVTCWRKIKQMDEKSKIHSEHFVLSGADQTAGAGSEDHSLIRFNSQILPQSVCCINFWGLCCVRKSSDVVWTAAHTEDSPEMSQWITSVDKQCVNHLLQAEQDSSDRSAEGHGHADCCRRW